MPNRNYVNGRAFEYRVMADLRAKGYYPKRSYASKGAEDIIAFKYPNCLFVQCKRGTGRMTDDERKELIELAKKYGGIPILAESPEHGIDYYELIGPGKEDFRRFFF